jgi:putative FmdB family regulatory protein
VTYDYACDSCGHEWEEEQSIHDDPIKRCPLCKKLKARRMISGGSGFILRGGCWERDGYSKDSSTGKKTDGGKADS